ncbi:hypothetical protein JRQ81_019128 [Phrynocephalus forsythii]|uniref:Amelogenin n=1 Tax=Phrynocephalus forsythii TaxID=171643 RepID=A0A9Q0XME4_9SAUR|nr:hypothetical protein JRQ81_019128 [Phrynocephalus forsythii]
MSGNSLNTSQRKQRSHTDQGFWSNTDIKNPRELPKGPAMRKMEGWILIMCVLSTTLAVPLPQHPGFINFSYEVMTPLKWYQGVMGHQYPRYGYEPMGGWMHHSPGSMMHQSPFQALHPMPPPLHQVQQQPPLNPHMQLPGHNTYVPMTGQNTLVPQYQPAHAGPVHQPVPPVAGEPPMHPQPPAHPNQPMHPQLPNPPMYPVQPLPPLIPDRPLESWPVPDKTKQEEVD